MCNRFTALNNGKAPQVFHSTYCDKSDIQENHTFKPSGSTGRVKDQGAIYNPKIHVSYTEADIGSNPSSSYLLVV